MNRAFICLLSALLTVNGQQLINTVSAYLDPPQVQAIVALTLTVNPSTTIPQNGSISFTFPQETPTGQTLTGCIIVQPPIIMQGSCTFSNTNGTLTMLVSGFDMPIENFVQITVNNFQSPRSTSPWSSFQFYSYDSSAPNKNVLDYQTTNIIITATTYDTLHDVQFMSSSQVVNVNNETLQVTFTTSYDMQLNDQLQLIVPKWNQNAGLAADSSFVSPIYCNQAAGLITPTGCSFVQGDNFDTVIIPNAFQSVVKAGSALSFTIGPFLNPISTSSQSGYDLTFLDQYGGVIYNSDGPLRISNPAIIPAISCSLSANSTQVANLSSYELSINLPVPLNQGCSLTIYIPQLLTFDVELNQVSIGGMFGSNQIVKYSVDPQQRSIFVQNACKKYLQNNTPAIISISMMRNPTFVLTIDSFGVTFSDIQNNQIAVANSGIVFTTTPGTIDVGGWSVTNYIVSTPTNLIMQFAPLHSAGKTTKIEVILPQPDFSLPQSCQISSYNSLVRPQTMNCLTNQTSNTITFTNLVIPTYSYKQGSYIQIAIVNVTMPSSTRPTGVYQINFYGQVNNTYFLVDQVTFNNSLQAQSGQLIKVGVKTGQNSTWTVDQLSISFIATHTILQGGWIQIVVPPELQIQSGSTCINPLQTTAKCSISGNVVNVTNCFPNADSLQGALIQFGVTNVLTQRSTRPSSIFTIITFDSNNYQIDYSNSFQLQLQAMQVITSFNLLQKSTLVGDQAPIYISLSSPIPILTQDSLMVTFPSNYLAQNLGFTYYSCSGTQLLLTNGLQCLPQGLNQLEIQMNFNNQTIVPANNTLQFQVANVSNPTSTRPSAPLNLQLSDQYGYLIINMMTYNPTTMTNFQLTATTPSALIFASVTLKSYVALSTTIAEFTIITNQLLPVSSNVEVIIPKQISMNQTQLLCQISTWPSSPINCTYTQSNSTINLFQINPNVAIFGGTQIVIEIGGIITSQYATLTDSFSLTTLTNDWFEVDSQTTSLQVASSCNYPCNQCPLNQPDVCQVCTTGSGSLFPLQFQNTCVAACPSNFYSFNQVCNQCDKSCLECTGQAQQCTKCKSGTFLLGTTCINICPDNYYSDPSQNLCVPCQSPCSTCKLSITSCTSCQMTQPLQSLFQNQCYSSCPIGPSVFSMGECKACSPDCLTCADSYDTCTSCRPDNRPFLDYLSYHCVDTCPKFVTVATILQNSTGILQPQTCELCDPKCKFCDPFNKTKCTKCTQGYVFNEIDGQCLQTCPLRTSELFVPLTQDYICQQCPKGCSNCTDFDSCNSCEAGYIFYQYQCLKTCPAGFNITLDAQPTCIRNSSICTYGYVKNSTTGLCELGVSQCKAGYFLNAGDNLCIPLPGAHAPGVFLSLVAAWTTFIIVMRHKHGNMMPLQQLLSQLLIGYVAIQQLAYFTMCILSFFIGYNFILVLHIAGFCGGCLVNTGSLIYTAVQLPKDLPFKHWRDTHLKVYYSGLVLSFFVSHQMPRIYNCGFMDKPSLHAVFQDQFRHFARPLFVMTCVGLIIQVAPIAYINIYTFIQIPIWGYEIRTCGFESLVLAILIFVLQVWDFVIELKLEKQLPMISQLPLYQKQKYSQKVKSVLDFGGGPPSLDFDNDKHDEQRRLIRNTNDTHQSQVDLLIGLHKKILEKTQLKEFETKFFDKKFGDEVLTIKEKKAQIVQNRKHFEKFRYNKKNFAGVPNIHVGHVFIDEPNQQILLKVGKHFKNRDRMTSQNQALDLFDARSDGEIERDKREFAIHYQESNDMIEKKKKRKSRLYESFDDDYLKDVYDNFGVCSDFESELSWISFPPQNPRKVYMDTFIMAKTSLMAEKIKYKFQYNNVDSDNLPEQIFIPKLQFPSRKTQTQMQTVGSRDPFDSSEDDAGNKSSESASQVDSKIVKNIFNVVCDGYTDSLAFNSARSRISKIKMSIDSNEINVVAIGSSKKRTRRETSILNRSRQLEYENENDQVLQKQHIQPPVPIGWDNISIQDMNIDIDEEAQIDLEVMRLQNDLSMDLIQEPKNLSCRSDEEPDQDRENFNFGRSPRASRCGKPKNRRDRQLHRAYGPDDKQLSFLHMQYPLDPPVLQQNNSPLRQSVTISQGKENTTNNLKIGKQSSYGEYASSAIDTAAEGANKVESVTQNQIGEAWDNSATSGSQVNLIGTQKESMRSNHTIVSEQMPKKTEERKVFNKFEHGYLFGIKEPQSVKKMINGVEYLPPVPFTKREKNMPFKSTKTKMKELEMERIKSQTMGIDKLRETEQVYLRIRSTKNETKLSSFTNNIGLSRPTTAHARPTTTSVERGTALINHKNLRKQNFMEEGSALMMQRKKGTTTSQGMNRDEKIRISRPASEGLHQDLKIALERIDYIRKLEMERHKAVYGGDEDEHLENNK